MSENKATVATGDSQREQCTAIETRWNELFRENFVIAARAELSLPDLTAAPNIGGTGRERPSPKRPLRQRVWFTETRRVACATLHHAIAVGVLLFYSRNLVGAAIRACVGA
jgi:hypothetical protein